MSLSARSGPSSWGGARSPLVWSAARSVRVSVHNLLGVSAFWNLLRWCHWAPRWCSTETEQGVAKSILYGPSLQPSRLFSAFASRSTRQVLPLVEKGPLPLPRTSPGQCSGRTTLKVNTCRLTPAGTPASPRQTCLMGALEM